MVSQLIEKSVFSCIGILKLSGIQHKNSTTYLYGALNCRKRDYYISFQAVVTYFSGFQFDGSITMWAYKQGAYNQNFTVFRPPFSIVAGNEKAQF